eukprot:scpid91806/ scgid10206/ 
MLPSFLTPEIDFMCPCVQASQFAAAHLPHAVNVPKGGAGGTVVEAHEGNFAIWAGTLIPKDDCIFIVATAGDEYESLERLARIGYTAHAVIIGGPPEWQADGIELESQQQIYPRDEQTVGELCDESSVVVDVRTPDEFASNHMSKAVNWPLAKIREHADTADRSKTHYCYCASGFRSTIGSSVLSRLGLTAVNVLGGFAVISVDFPHRTSTGKICPTMKKNAQAMKRLYEQPASQ